MDLRIASRKGNVVIGVLGVLFAASAAIELAVLVAQTGGAAGLVDRAIQLVLAGVIFVSIWFTRIAARTLGWHFRLHAPGHTASAPGH